MMIKIGGIYCAVLLGLLCGTYICSANPYSCPLPQTGQATSYRDGDDGYHQSGIEWPSSRFKDNGNGTVTDTLTGLMWFKNANHFGLGNWNSAVSGCYNLNSAGHSDWRLPTRKELTSLLDYSQYAPSLQTGHPFLNVFNEKYWTSTTMEDDHSNAWTVNFGEQKFMILQAAKTLSRRIWPVRNDTETSAICSIPESGQIATYLTGDDGNLKTGEPWPVPRFIDNGDGTVTDHLTGSMWKKDLKGSGYLHWNEAVDYCKNLNYATYTDWRLPTFPELESLVDCSQDAPVFPAGTPFINATGGTFWSSTTSSSATTNALWLNAYNGFVNARDKLNVTGSAPAVRTLPMSTDTDNDGMLDSWEILHFGNIDSCDPLEDFDSDGCLNQHEYIAGTDPKLPTSYFQIVNNDWNSNNQISFQSEEGRLYNIEYREDLYHGDWQSLTNFSGTGTMLNYLPSKDLPATFYRVTIQMN